MAEALLVQSAAGVLAFLPVGPALHELDSLSVG